MNWRDRILEARARARRNAELRGVKYKQATPENEYTRKKELTPSQKYARSISIIADDVFDKPYSVDGVKVKFLGVRPVRRSLLRKSWTYYYIRQGEDGYTILSNTNREQPYFTVENKTLAQVMKLVDN